MGLKDRLTWRVLWVGEQLAEVLVVSHVARQLIAQAHRVVERAEAGGCQQAVKRVLLLPGLVH